MQSGSLGEGEAPAEPLLFCPRRRIRQLGPFNWGLAALDHQPPVEPKSHTAGPARVAPEIPFAPVGRRWPIGRMRGTTETKHMGMCFWEGEAPAEPLPFCSRRRIRQLGPFNWGLAALDHQPPVEPKSHTAGPASSGTRGIFSNPTGFPSDPPQSGSPGANALPKPSRHKERAMRFSWPALRGRPSSRYAALPVAKEPQRPAPVR